MQFIKSWDCGAKSCRITYNHPDSKLKITIYPMLQMASPVFYQKVSDDLKRFKFILYERAANCKNNRKHPLYSLTAKSLGLTEQKDSLKLPSDISLINIDIPSYEFRNDYKTIPVWKKLMIYLWFPITWLAISVKGKGG